MNNHGGKRPGAGRPTGTVSDVTTRFNEAKADKERALADLRTMEAATRARELIPASEMEQAVSTAFNRIAQALLSLPDTLERKAGLSPAQAETAQHVIHAAMDALADDLARLGPGDA